MHPRNPYQASPDFIALADAYPPLKPFVALSSSGTPFIDFKNPDAQRTLTQALVKRDFGLELELPENRLCPPVPNRLNYILWIEDILSAHEALTHNERVRGIDIGTGASAIFPLLGCSLPTTRSWEFVGTEIDQLSAKYAARNVEANSLRSRITIWPIRAASSPEKSASQLNGNNDSEGEPPILAPLLEDPLSTFAFTMCNPPFYGSHDEMIRAAVHKEFPPNAVFTGAATETITRGGETTFVLRMLHESAGADVRGRCGWFTSMLGKLSSVGVIVEALRTLEFDNYALAQFVQGGTRRWAIAWTFGDRRLPDSIARPTSAGLAPYLPAPTTLRQTFPGAFALSSLPPASQLAGHVRTALSRIADIGSHEDGRGAFDVCAAGNTWSRAARRRRQHRGNLEAGLGGRGVAGAPALGCRISVVGMTLEAQWVRGRDRALYEGFWNHLCRKVKDELGTCK